jgi:amino acid adenylation domain-containing protein
VGSLEDGLLSRAPAAPQDASAGVPFPLSLSQREVWRDRAAWPDSPHLMIGGGGFLDGPLDVPRCVVALRLLVQESDALRLAPLPDGTQRLLARWEPALELVEVPAGVEPCAAMQDWWRAALARPFAFDGTPPWRFALLRVHPTLHGLAMQFHHVVMDGWGTSQVMARWSALYNQLDGGAVAPPAAAPYAEFITESQAYLGSESFARDAAYWNSQVTRLPEPLLERRPDAQRHAGLPAAHLATWALPRGAYQELVRQAAAREQSPFVCFLAALALYFGRLAGRSQVLVGVPTLNRGGRRFRATPGMFVGVLALAIDVTPGQSAGELVAGAAAAMRAALRRPRYPLSELARSLQILRSGRDSLFDLILSFEQQDYAVHFGAARRVDSRQFFSGVARYGLGVTVCEFHPEQDLELVLEASADCFTHEEVDPLARRLWHLAQLLAAEPLRPVGELPLVAPEEQAALLAPAIPAAPDVEPCIRSFERHAAARPDAVALVWDGGSMDYGTLDARANRLAHRLVALGAGRDRVVAVALPRSADLVVAVLAIAKAGAACLPLDPDAPVARLAGILQDSGALALLLQEDALDRLGVLHPRAVVTGWEPALADHTAMAPPVTLQASDLAYVLFTSGSTGRPKGVMVEHAALAQRMAWLTRTYGVVPQDRSALATQATFDPSLIELYLPLVNGAGVALAPPGRLHPESVAEFAMRHAVTIMAFVPSTLSGFLDAAAGRPALRLRVACCGGEVLSPELMARYLAGTSARLFNVYGPTEACIFATAWACVPQSGGQPLPIGTPVDGTVVRVLDDALRLQPWGVPGEICIGGAGLARGYLNQPALTAAAFVDDPHRPGERLYRTGDRGWLTPDGQLHFSGRLDRQVKLRGYRVELGEIEAALLAAEGVTQAAVQPVQSDGRLALHAWVGGAGAPAPESLLRLLRLRLPDYMVPARLVVLPELPCNSTGKIDHAALPPIPAPAPVLAHRAPASALERDLLAIWQEALGRRSPDGAGQLLRCRRGLPVRRRPAHGHRATAGAAAAAVSAHRAPDGGTIRARHRSRRPVAGRAGRVWHGTRADAAVHGRVRPWGPDAFPEPGRGPGRPLRCAHAAAPGRRTVPAHRRSGGALRGCDPGAGPAGRVRRGLLDRRRRGAGDGADAGAARCAGARADPDRHRVPEGGLGWQLLLAHLRGAGALAAHRAAEPERPAPRGHGQRHRAVRPGQGDDRLPRHAGGRAAGADQDDRPGPLAPDAVRELAPAHGSALQRAVHRRPARVDLRGRQRAGAGRAAGRHPAG